MELASITLRMISAKVELATSKSMLIKNTQSSSSCKRSGKFEMVNLEDRDKRCNIHVYGLPENREKDSYSE